MSWVVYIVSKACSIWRHLVSGSPKQDTEYSWFFCLYSCSANSVSLFRGSKQRELFERIGAVVAPALSLCDQAHWAGWFGELSWLKTSGSFFCLFFFFFSFLFSLECFLAILVPWVGCLCDCMDRRGGLGYSILDLHWLTKKVKLHPDMILFSFYTIKLGNMTDYCKNIKRNFRTTCLIYCALESLYSHVFFLYFYCRHSYLNMAKEKIVCHTVSL